MTKKMELKGFIYSLFIEGQYIENFASVEDAKSYIETICSLYKGTNYFVRPIPYYTLVETSP